ncbi:MAG TPA: SDR family oxidoreductase [Chthoniobacteraceae bacterium]|nr:SDR family oxidoreductase [Chthoniobacteraceae bacterium]
MSRPSVLVVGCGFLGLPLARRLHAAGCDVLGLTHSEATAAGLSGELFPVRACDVSNADSVGEIAKSRTGKFDVVVHCASSGKGGPEAYQRVYLEGCAHLLEQLAPRQIIFTSSTSVYAQVGGEPVTEESLAEPAAETGRLLRETEELVLAHGGTALRLAALYGPGRSVLLRKFFSGEAVIEGDGARWINQIHRDDAVEACVQVIERGATGIYNVSDDRPLQQAAVYEFLARHFERPLPPAGEVNLNKKRGFSNKRVANEKLRALGWRPKYATFFEAVESDPGIAAAARAEAAHSS